MAVTTGRDGTVKVGANAVAEVRSFSLETTGDTVEATRMTHTSRQFKPTLTSWTVSIDCFWDPTDTNGQVALGVNNQVTLNLYPAADGGTGYSGNAIITGFTTSSSFDGLVEASITCQGTGTLGDL